MSPVSAGLATTRVRIESAARSAGRAPEQIRLIAVSKTKPAAAIREAYAAGQRDFGENYVQELLTKAEELRDLSDLRWHLIGHLQRNKARQVVGICHLIHSVDSLRLVTELARRAADAERTAALGVLVEVNVGAEPQKTGCNPAELGEILAAIAAAPALTARGLMTVPPHTDDPEGAAPYFARLAALRDEHGGAAALPELSMGMTHDLEVAIRSGATMVRVGTAIFGSRS